MVTVNEHAGKLESLLKDMGLKTPSYKSRFLVKSGQSRRSVNVGEIMYFYIEHQLVFLTVKNGGKFLVEKTLDELETAVDPRFFFGSTGR